MKCIFKETENVENDFIKSAECSRNFCHISNLSTLCSQSTSKLKNFLCVIKATGWKRGLNNLMTFLSPFSMRLFDVGLESMHTLENLQAWIKSNGNEEIESSLSICFSRFVLWIHKFFSALKVLLIWKLFRNYFHSPFHTL
jgi:hypothetical protein